MQITDWMPTLAALAGYRPDRDLKWDGTDITSLLTDHTPLPDRPLYAVAPGWRARSLRFGDWKLIEHDAKPAPRVELFDLATDASETRNQADTRPDLVGKLSKMMERSPPATGTPWPTTRRPRPGSRDELGGGDDRG